jgi:hypothetical protein
MRAPIFYDANDTAYFCDPNGRSRLSSMDYGNGSYYLAGGDWGYRHNTPYGWIQFGPANSGHAHIYTDRSNFYFNVYDMYLNGYRVATYDWNYGASLRASIFYDANDTGFYADFNSTGTDAVVIRGGTRHGPNNSWGAYMRVGTDGRQDGWASVMTTNGNLHLDCRNGYETLLNWYSGGIVYVNESIRPQIMYDRNDTGYYCDPASTNRLNFVNSNNHYINAGYMLYSDSGGWTGEYNKIQWHSSHTYYQVINNGYHIFRYGGDGLESHQLARDGNHWTRYLGWLSNWANQSVRTDAGPTFQEVYTNGWFRNNNSGQGLYNQSRGMHWYSNNGYWKSAGGGYGYGGIVMYNNYESDLRGYGGYWDGSGFGMLNSSGNWQIRIEYGNAHMELYRVTWASDMRAYIFYDRDNTGYYSNPDSDSRVYRINANYLYSYGWVLAQDNVIAYYSDERLKTKLGNIDSALDKLGQLNGFYYENNDLAKSFGYTETKRQVGLSAQEVQNVMPEIIALAPFDTDFDDDTKQKKSRTGENYLTVQYDKLVPLLVEAIKELSGKVDDLRDDFEELKNEFFKT